MRFSCVVFLLLFSGCKLGIANLDAMPPIKTKPRKFVPYPEKFKEQLRHRRVIKDRARQIAAENGRDLDAENRARMIHALIPDITIFGS